MKKYLLVSLFVLHMQLSYSQCYCCGSTSGFSGGESGLGDLALPRNKVMVEAALDLRVFNGIKGQSHSQELGVSTTTALAITHMEIGVVGVRYGITDKTSVLIQQPFFLIYTSSSLNKSSGDLLSLVNYRLLSREGITVDGQAGIEWPTGQFVALSNGSSISTGSGSYDPVAGLAAKFPLGKGGLRFAGFFKYSTKGYNGTYYGNFFGQQIDYTYALTSNAGSCSPDTLETLAQKINLSLKFQLSGEWAQMQKNANAFVENTGSYVALASAGVVLARNGFTIPVMLSLPVVQRFHGEQNSNAFRIRVGISKLF